eukprot:366381-Chlamydomonas_euryale.AAC.7
MGARVKLIPDVHGRPHGACMSEGSVRALWTWGTCAGFLAGAHFTSTSPGALSSLLDGTWVVTRYKASVLSGARRERMHKADSDAGAEAQVGSC